VAEASRALQRPTACEGCRVQSLLDLADQRPRTTSDIAQQRHCPIHRQHTQNKVSKIKYTTQPPFYGHYTGQPALAGTSSQELEDFVGAKFYYPHTLADGNQRIRIRQKMLEFSSTVLSSLSLTLV